MLALDVAAEAAGEARNRTREMRVRSLTADACRLPIASGSIEVVVCLEVFEHVECRDEMLREIDRVLTPSGSLILSTPNKKIYAESGPPGGNPFHVKEYEREELLASLRRHFQHVQLMGQVLAEGVLFYEEPSPGETVRIHHGLAREENHETGPLSLEEPDYFIALCGKGKSSWAPSEPRGSFYATPPGSFERLRKTVRLQEQDLDEKRQWAFDLLRQVEEYRQRLQDLERELEQRSRWAQELDAELKDRHRQLVELRQEIHELSGR